jgi:hypothetical protein
LVANNYLQAPRHFPASRWNSCCLQADGTEYCLPIFTYKQIIIARQADETDVVCQYLPTSRLSLLGKQMGLNIVCQYLPTSRLSLLGKQMGLMLSASTYLQADYHCPASRWD